MSKAEYSEVVTPTVGEEAAVEVKEEQVEEGWGEESSSSSYEDANEGVEEEDKGQGEGETSRGAAASSSDLTTPTFRVGKKTFKSQEKKEAFVAAEKTRQKGRRKKRQAKKQAVREEREQRRREQRDRKRREEEEEKEERERQRRLPPPGAPRAPRARPSQPPRPRGSAPGPSADQLAAWGQTLFAPAPIHRTPSGPTGQSISQQPFVAAPVPIQAPTNPPATTREVRAAMELELRKANQRVQAMEKAMQKEEEWSAVLMARIQDLKREADEKKAEEAEEEEVKEEDIKREEVNEEEVKEEEEEEENMLHNRKSEKSHRVPD